MNATIHEHHACPARGATSAPVLQARGVRMSFGRTHALVEVDLDIPRDRVTVILGRNGAGKSTLLRLALGIGRPSAGRLTVLGLDPWRATASIRARIGFVPDVPDVPAWITPREWLAFLAPHHARFDRERGLALLRTLDVPLDARFKTLSRGQGMSAMLAAAIAPDPEVLLLDEPFGGLDPVAREDILRTVIGEIRGQGRSVILTTHDLDVASRIAEHVVVIDQGRVRFAGAMEDMADPQDGKDGMSTPERLLQHLAPRARLHEVAQ